MVLGISDVSTVCFRYLLQFFVESQKQDMCSSKQMRLMSCRADTTPVGTIDMFEFEPQHRRAGIGILIAPQHRREGYARDALMAFEQYATSTLNLHQIWCNVGANNRQSITLFESLGYRRVGVKRDWLWTPQGFVDEIMMQKLFFAD